MTENLKISILQTDLLWESPEKNHTLFENYFTEQSETTHLIVLPEMFSSGFTREFTEKKPYPSLAWLQKLSKRQKAYVYGSIAAEDNKNSYNRGLWVKPDGNYTQYNKKHLFKYGKEHLAFTPGNSILQTSIDNWIIRPLICYDLRFPVWSRNTKPYYDILIYVASWPAARRDAWKSLLKARAIENQCYVIGVNRTGKDGNNLEYSGDSCVFDYNGVNIFEAEDRVGRFDITLSYLELLEFRKKFPFLEDADSWSWNF